MSCHWLGLTSDILFCLVNPRIPDSCRFGADLFDNDAAIPLRVVYNSSGVGIQMDPIGFLGDKEGLAAQLLPFESVGFVDVGTAFKPGAPCK